MVDCIVQEGMDIFFSNMTSSENHLYTESLSCSFRKKSFRYNFSRKFITFVRISGETTFPKLSLLDTSLLIQSPKPQISSSSNKLLI